MKPTWAAVVRSGKGVSNLQEQRTREMEVMLKEAKKNIEKKVRKLTRNMLLLLLLLAPMLLL